MPGSKETETIELPPHQIKTKDKPHSAVGPHSNSNPFVTGIFAILAPNTPTMKPLLPSLILLLSCLAFGKLPAQTGTLRGSLTDARSGEPLIGATIKARDTGTTTDALGQYELILPKGAHDITYSYLGYQSATRTVIIEAGKVLEVDIALEESATILQMATVTSGKYEKPLGEVTVSLDVIKPRLVESINTTSVSQVLDKMPGFNMIGGQANIRGGSGYSYGAGSRVLLLIDDIPILTADAGFPNWKDVPIENLAQIEVVKGAASALYGSSALNGIVNIRTAFAGSSPELKAAVFHGQVFAPKNKEAWWWKDRPQPFSTGASASYKQKFGRFDLVAGLFAQHDRSYNRGEYSSYKRFNLNTLYRFNDRLTLGLNANINAGEGASFFFWKDAEVHIFEGAPGTYSRTRSLRYNLDPRLTYFDPAGNKHKFLGRYYSVGNNSNNNQSNASKVYYGEYQFQRKWEKLNLMSTAGLVYSGSHVAAPLYGDTTYTSRNIAAYVQVEKKFFSRLNLSAGLRYEDNLLNNPGFSYRNNFGEEVIIEPSVEREAKPVLRLGANYQLAAYTYLRASWGQGYRYPTIAEKYIRTSFGGVPISPSPDLKSETGWSAELGLKQGFKVSGFSGLLDLAIFYNRYRNMMEFTFIDFFLTGFQSRNVGNTNIKGLEISLMGQGKTGPIFQQIIAGYTYIDPRFDQFDTTAILPGQDPSEGQLNAFNSSADYNVLKYRYRHTFKLDWQADYRTWSIGIALQHNSFMEAIDAIFEELVVPGLAKFRENENGQGATTLNIRLAWQLNPNHKLSFLLNNLLNETYYTRPGQLQMPRNASIRWDMKF